MNNNPTIESAPAERSRFYSRHYLRGWIEKAAEVIRDYRGDLPDEIREFAAKVAEYLDGEE